MSDGAALGIAALLLLGNAFFVGAEFALISARRTQIEPRAAAGSVAARITLRGMEKVSLMMAGAQLGITMCSLGLGAIGEPAVAHLLEPALESLGMPEALLHPIAFVVAMTIVVGLHMVLGEMVPKNIAIAGPERSALVLGPILYAFVTAIRPLLLLLNGIANQVLRRLGITPADEVASTFTREQVATMIATSKREGLLDAGEAALLVGALEVRGRTAAELMIPNARVRSVPHAAQARDVHKAAVETGFSRFPVLDADGVPAAYVHVKDVLPKKGEGLAGQPVSAGPRRALPDIAATASVGQVVEGLRAARSHLGRVIADGRVVGIVALEDAIEELIGEVRDPAHR